MKQGAQDHHSADGLCLVLSAPSGTGKTTISRLLLEADPSVVRSVSMTTRPPRPGEVDGRDYHFTTPDRFRALIGQEAFLEWAEVHGDLYGTPKAAIEGIIRNGQVALMVIDVQGGQSIKAIFPDAVLVFLIPPSLETLEQRLRARGTEGEEIIRKRLQEAQVELQYVSQYTYRVVNEEGKQQRTVDTVRAIITAERCRVSRWENR
jgi:guanylate kinase